ncbi:activating signal cointegrator 1 complex subunit 1 [Lycorma delicatula]|uniref:activating signal cointegrator 1 complex subunit 1 n=1 Tax=Lycorma delicatula TaxID=130591 RepID=UPI003F512262
MDVLKPDLLYIKGRCFRINPMNISLNDDSSGNKKTIITYEEDCSLDYNDSEEEEDNKCVIESIDGKRYRTAFHVARAYFPFIIGTKGATRKRLETETKTQINVPRLGQDGDIVITGNSKNNILIAYRRVNLIIMTARRRQQYTHFISIPFCGEQVKKRFLEFKKEVLEQCKDRGVEESVFQSADKLHMTLCTMVLSDDVERNNAAQILQKCKTDVIDGLLNGQSLKLRICGIEIMNDDPAEVNVLYGRIHCQDEELLQTLSDSIVSYCIKAGIVEKEHERVKLHITLMNTIFRKSSSEFGNENKRNRDTINASSILKSFENFDFGEETVTSIHLSQMGTVSNSGYYKASVKISF